MRNKKIVPRVLLVLYFIAVGILCFCRFDGSIDLPATFWGIPQDKVAHFLMFLPYPILTALALHTSKGNPKGLILFLLWIVIAGAVIAGATELIQGTTGYRESDITDFRADCIGIFTGSVLTLIYGAVSRKW
ncbi:MAG: VanZ family protein [Candidatus Cryptobacteroides sp.]